MLNHSYRYVYAILAAIFVMTFSLSAMAKAQVGEAAPTFTATDIEGNAVDLAALKGKTVVLEWTNHQCPYVIKHYDSGNMQRTQKMAKEDGVVWVSIVSSAPGKQGHLDLEEAKEIVAKEGAYPAHKVLDESGEIGKLYKATTTPHMFVIDEAGVLAYAGAIDSNSSPRPSAVEGATNYVLAALGDLKEGNTVQTAQTQPYGCSVKY